MLKPVVCFFVCLYLFEPVCGSLSVYLWVTVFISKSRSGLGRTLPLVAWLCTYSDDVNKVVFSQRVQNGVDGVLGYGQPEPLHAAADIHHDHHVFRRRGRLDIPENRRIKFRAGSDISSTLLDGIYQQSSRQTRAGGVQALSFYLFPRSSIHASPHLLIIILWLSKLININEISCAAAATGISPETDCLSPRLTPSRKHPVTYMVLNLSVFSFSYFYPVECYLTLIPLGTACVLSHEVLIIRHQAKWSYC